MSDPVIAAAAAVLLGITPIYHQLRDCQLPNPPPIHCASGWDHDCQPNNHITVRWVDNRPVTTAPMHPVKPMHEHHRHHHRRGHHH